MGKEQIGPYKLGFNPSEIAGVYQGDSAELIRHIPDESIDLICTDPIYDDMGQYARLAREAKRVLRPNSACLVWAGIGYLPAVLRALSQFLSYRWVFSSVLPVGKRGSWAQYKMFSNWRCLLWFEKGKSQAADYFSDVQFESDNRHTGLQSWGKSVITTKWWIRPFPGVVLDPFCGGGTVPVAARSLDRPYLAFDQDGEMIKLARKRVKNTQPPLFTVEPEQQEMNFDE